MEGQICIGMAGAGRATELHMNALMRFSEFPVRYKRIVARRQGQVNDMKERYGFEIASLDFDDLLRVAVFFLGTNLRTTGSFTP